MSKRNFTASVKELSAGGQSAGIIAIAIEPAGTLPGPPPDGLMIVLNEGGTIEDAQELARHLNRVGFKIVTR